MSVHDTYPLSHSDICLCPDDHGMGLSKERKVKESDWILHICQSQGCSCMSMFSNKIKQIKGLLVYLLQTLVRSEVVNC